MKIFWIVLAILVVAFATFALVNYLLQRRRQQRAEREGTVVYATLLSVEPMTGLAKYAQMQKIALRVQEPGDNTPREVTIRTRSAPGQKLSPGMKIAVILDPTNPKRVFPASPEAAKRAVVTGSRQERRLMKNGALQRQQPQRPTYQPPIKTGRR